MDNIQDDGAGTGLDKIENNEVTTNETFLEMNTTKLDDITNNIDQSPNQDNNQQIVDNTGGNNTDNITSGNNTDNITSGNNTDNITSGNNTTGGSIITIDGSNIDGNIEYDIGGEDNKEPIVNVSVGEEYDSDGELFGELQDIDYDKVDNFLTKRNILKKQKYEDHIQNKLSKINLRMRYAEHKYNDIREQFNRLGLVIIIISFLLTLLEAFRNTMDLENDITNPLVRNLIKLIPLILSTLVSFLTAVVKFNKYEEKIESLIKATEKCIYTISEMKKIKETLYFCNDNELDTVIGEFERNVYPKYLSNNVDIEKQLNDNDYSKYIHIVNNMDITNFRMTQLKNRILTGLEKNEDISDLETQMEHYNSKNTSNTYFY